MRDDSEAALLCEPADAQRFGEPADPSDIGLHDMHVTAVHEVEELEPGREPLAGGDRDRRALCQPGVLVQIV